MSGPVRPPLEVTEVDGSPDGRPINKIIVSNGDLSISGTTATIDTSGAGGTAALTDTYVGFGSGSNLLTGSAKLTWNDTAGSEQLKVSGSGVTDGGLVIENTNTGVTSAPDLVLHRNVTGTDNDFIGRMDFRGQDDTGNDVNYLMMTMKIQDASEDAGRLGFFVSGNASLNADDSQLMIFGRTGLTGNPGLVSINNSGRSDVDFRISGDTETSLFYTDASADRVGIGTNAPDALFHVKTSDTTTVIFEGAKTSDGTLVDISFKNSSDSTAQIGVLRTGANDACAMIFGTQPTGGNVTERMRIASDGKVGIGEDSPDALFHVKTSDSSVDTVIFESTDTDGADDGPDLVLYRKDESPGDGVQLGSLKFRGRNNASADIGYAHIEAEVESGFGTSANGLLRLGVVADGTSPTDIVYVSGAGSSPNVGIGTIPDSDVERLHIKGSGDDTLVRLESTETGAGSAPELNLYRSATATTDDVVGQIRFQAKSATGSINITAATLYTQLKAVSGTAMDSVLHFDIRKSNSSTSALQLGNTEAVFNEGSADIDFRVESNGNANMLKINSNNDNMGIAGDPSSSVESLHIFGTQSANPIVRVETSDSGGTDGPDIELYRNSSTPADGDDLGVIEFVGNSDDGAGTITTGINYARITGEIADVTTGTEDARLLFKCITAGGAAQEYLRMGMQDVIVNEGSGDINFRVESNNNANMLKIDGGMDRIGIGAAPATGLAQLQVDDSASFLYYTPAIHTSNYDLTEADCHNTLHYSKTASGTISFVLPAASETVAGMKVTLINTGGNVQLVGQAAEGQKMNGTAASSTEPTAAFNTSFSRLEAFAIDSDDWAVYVDGAIATITNT